MEEGYFDIVEEERRNRGEELSQRERVSGTQVYER